MYVRDIHKYSTCGLRMHRVRVPVEYVYIRAREYLYFSKYIKTYITNVFIFNINKNIYPIYVHQRYT